MLHEMWCFTNIFHFYFTDDETEAQEVKPVAQEDRQCEVESGFKPSLPDLKV